MTMSDAPAAPADAKPARTPTPAQWMAARGWKPFAFQREVWRALSEGRSGLLHATTGSGKTYAVWLGALAQLSGSKKRPAALATTERARRNAAPPLTVLWITPMRALAADSLRALTQPLADLAPNWTTGLRTGDTPSG